MKRFLQLFSVAIILAFTVNTMFAGNPDRQGEAGAAELLMNPWARSAGLHSMNTSFVSGVDAMRLNVAGLSYNRQMQVQVAHTRYLAGIDLNFHSAGLSLPTGENGTMGISLMLLDFGDIPRTTTDNPDFNPDRSFSPSFFNFGIGYSHTFDNKVSVGILGRVVSEGISDINTLFFCFDTGVQYVAGEEDNFKLGISLRNIGVSSNFSGEGLSLITDVENVERTVFTKGADFNLPFTLNLGVSYDFYFTEVHRLTTGLNFTSNAFLRDQAGPMVEYSYKDLFHIRGAYKVKLDDAGATGGDDAYTGFAGGVGVSGDLSDKTDTRIHVNYAYRNTKIFNGTHNFSLGLSF